MITGADRPTNPDASGLTEYLGQLILFYVVAHVFPFPMAWIPGLEALVDLCGAPWRALVTLVGDRVFGVEAVPRHNGSGDTAFAWIGAGCLFVLALIAALVWRRAPGARISDRARAYVGLYLGAKMLLYGWVKLLPVQFIPPGPARLILPLGDLTPQELMWSFMGASTGYQMTIGLIEVIAGFLLFWRRTALLGALLTLAVMSNVVLMNFGYDVPVKLDATHLVLLALFVATPDLGRLVDLLWFGRTVAARTVDPFPLASKRWRRVRATGKAVLLVFAVAAPMLDALPYLAPPSSLLRGQYRVDAFERDGHSGEAMPEAERWVQVGLDPLGLAAFVTADGRGQSLALAIDEANATMTFRREDGTRFVLSYAPQEPDVLRVWGEVDGAPVRGRLRRDERRFELLAHKTRLINEGRR